MRKRSADETFAFEKPDLNKANLESEKSEDDYHDGNHRSGNMSMQSGRLRNNLPQVTAGTDAMQVSQYSQRYMP
jgi:hypothetical protein